MAIFNFRNASVVYNSVNISDHVRSVTLTMTADDLDATAMGNTSHTHVPGLRDDRIELELFQDFAAGSVDVTFAAQIGVAAGVVVVVKPDSGATSATNPSYTMTGVLLDYHPLDGEVGSLSRTTVVLVPAQNSSIVRATA